MSHTKRVAINTAILYIRMAITVSMSLYTTRLVLQTLGAEDFGIFNLVAGTIAMLTFLNNSMSTATQRFMSYAQGQGCEERQTQIFSASIVLHTITAILILAILEAASLKLFNGVFNIKSERQYAAWMVYQFAAISTFFAVLSVPYDAVINARENMLLFAILSVIESIIKLAIAIFIIDSVDDKLMLYGQLMVVMSIMLVVIRVIYCHLRYSECSLKIYKNFDWKLVKEITIFSGWSFLLASSTMIANYGQGLVLNIFFGSTVNTAHGISSQISGQLGVLAGNMMKALNPLIMKSEGAGDRLTVINASIIGSKIGFLLLMIMYVPFLIEMPFLLKIWLKDVPEYTVVFCSLLLIRNLVEQLFSTLISAISATGDIKEFQIVSFLFAPIALGCSFVLFEFGYPPYYLYICFLLYSLIMLFIVSFYSKKLIDLKFRKFFVEVVFKCVALFFLVYFISKFSFNYMDPGVEKIIAETVVAIFCSFILSYIFLLDKNERDGIKILVYRFFK